MRTLPAILVVLAAAWVVGCGAKRPQADLDRGRAAVVAALDGWKANEPAEKLKALADPVDFTEELRASHKLTDYAIGKVDAADADVIRFTVTLKMTDYTGKAVEREVAYAVSLRSPVAVARDPYF